MKNQQSEFSAPLESAFSKEYRENSETAKTKLHSSFNLLFDDENDRQNYLQRLRVSKDGEEIHGLFKEFEKKLYKIIIIFII